MVCVAAKWTEPEHWPRTRIRWQRSARIIPSRYPPVGVFDRIKNPIDLELLFLVESLTNERVLEQWGDLSLVAEEDRISGPGTTPIMAAFTHPSPRGGRFTSPEFGAYYAARTLKTAIKESVFSQARFLTASSIQQATTLDVRVYYATIKAQVLDLRGDKRRAPWLYRPEPSSYPATQAFASKARGAGETGLIYPSIRDNGGGCVVIFKPKAISDCRQGEHFTYQWNGREMTGYFEKGNYVEF